MRDRFIAILIVLIITSSTPLFAQAGAPQTADALAGRTRIWILESDDNALRLGSEKEVRACRPAPALMRAGFEADVNCCALCALPGLSQRKLLGVRPATGRGHALTYEPT